jgi:methyl-accepting chemotaxis protein
MAHKTTIQRLLAVGFGIAVAGAIVIGVFATFGLNKGIENALRTTSVDVPLVVSVEKLRNNMLMLRRYEKDYLLNIGSPDKQQGYLHKYNNQLAAMATLLTDFKAIIDHDGVVSGRAKDRAGSLSGYYDQYKAGFFAVVHTLQTDDEITPQQANRMMGTTKDAVHAFEEVLVFLQGEFNTMLQGTVDDVVVGGSRIKNILLGIISAGTLLLVGISVFMGRRIVGVLSRSVESVSVNAQQLASASSSIARNSQGLAESASEQAAALEQAAAAVDQLAAQARQNSEHSTEAGLLMEGTELTVQQAKLIMEDLTLSMGEISKASEQTSKIVKTIDEIAFQTNLLALNAAVEAARAGEAGAGFAVVADEVRNLAMRAAEATKTTADLIDATMQRVGAGTVVVEKTSDAFTRIIEGTDKVAVLIGEIRASSREQTEGTVQLSQGISAMSASVQVVAANSEEAASASEEMNGQTVCLQDVVEDLSRLVGMELEINPGPGLDFTMPGAVGRAYLPGLS